MNLPIKKIITASAGTGKTYRLSLEYIALILQYSHSPEFKPDQILVVTFTKKATAEIRDRIYKQMSILGYKSDGWKELAKNLKTLILKDKTINADIPLSEKEVTLIRNAYEYLITHKDELRVMTIDSYINGIFRNLVRPVRGIDRFDLDDEAVGKRLPFLFRELMSETYIKRVSKLLSTGIKPSLDKYNKFFTQLIENRWFYYLVKKQSKNINKETLAYYSSNPELCKEKAEEYFQAFCDTYKHVIQILDSYLDTLKGVQSESDKLNYINERFKSVFSPMPDEFVSLAEMLPAYLKDDFKADAFFNAITFPQNIWNGVKIKTNKDNGHIIDELKNLHDLAKRYFADYLLFHLFIPEQKEIIDIWQDVLEHYDKLIYRYKNFTYSDITWFTFEALYSPEPPLFQADNESVVNEFYEFMCHRTRFILIDEFQDTDVIQFHILAPMIEELMAGAGSYPYGGLVVVGDDKQSIFSWRGGQRELLLNLDKIIQPGIKAEKEALTGSWRSSPSIIDFINKVYSDEMLHNFLHQHNMQWLYNDIESQQPILEQDTVIQFRLYNQSDNNANKKDSIRTFVEEMLIPALPLLSEANAYPKIAVLARTNNHLETIRTILAEHRIKSEFQSSNSIMEHDVVKAVVYLLKFAVYGNWFDFLAFLRSDIVLLDGIKLKKVIDIISDYQKGNSTTGIVFSDIKEAQAAYDIAVSLNVSEIYLSILKIYQSCQIHYKLHLMRDFVNIQQFLDIALEYESNYQSELPELQGFLRFCKDNSKLNTLKQKDLQSRNAIQLLTIHKSKGLEFDIVFIWDDFGSGKANVGIPLHSWVAYSGTSFNNIGDCAFTMNYRRILKTSSFSNLMLEEETKAQLEELNAYYVAMTRAKSRLYMFFSYTKTKGWPEYWKSRLEGHNLLPVHYAVASAYSYMQDNAIETEPDYFIIDKRENLDTTNKVVIETSTEKPTDAFPDLRSMLSDWQNRKHEFVENQDINPDMNWKTSFLKDRDNLKGNIAHYYMSQLKYATREEIELAKVLTLRRFGNLMTLSVLSDFISGLESRLHSFKDLFNPDYDLVFNEYPVFYKGKEYHIDRLMINTQAKTFRIIDFKTGGIYNEQQLSFYESIVSNTILKDGYTLEKKDEYLDITI